MKSAARFPISSCNALRYLIWIFHGLLLFVSMLFLQQIWQQVLMLLSLWVSVFYSLKNYHNITQAADDLCWNGESWLMFQQGKNQDVVYYELLPTSWLSSQLALLHFIENGKQQYWLFSRFELGERAFSELLYLARQSLSQSAKQIQNAKHGQ